MDHDEFDDQVDSVTDDSIDLTDHLETDGMDMDDSLGDQTVFETDDGSNLSEPDSDPSDPTPADDGTPIDDATAENAHTDQDSGTNGSDLSGLRFGGHWNTVAVYDEEGNWVSNTSEWIAD